MYEIQVYPITDAQWRWEIRCDGTLLCCGTAHDSDAAELDAREINA